MTSDPNNTEIPQPVGSSALIPPLLRTASGIVLDIGPGTGTQMPLLTSPAITALYGAEPCKGLHPSIREKAVTENISSKYHIVPTGVAAAELIPALRATGTGVVDAYDSDARVGIFDTILCVRVLCSVPEMKRTVGELYGMLKPGGRLLVTEHVVNPWRRAKGSIVARVVQGIYQMLGWSWFTGDCCLDRDTEAVLRAAADVDGGWESVELERSFEWSAMPYISGVLVKKGV
jgi:SAM-dependent methyltransferase